MMGDAYPSLDLSRDGSFFQQRERTRVCMRSADVFAISLDAVAWFLKWHISSRRLIFEAQIDFSMGRSNSDKKVLSLTLFFDACVFCTLVPSRLVAFCVCMYFQQLVFWGSWCLCLYFPVILSLFFFIISLFVYFNAHTSLLCWFCFLFVLRACAFSVLMSSRKLSQSNLYSLRFSYVRSVCGVL